MTLASPCSSYRQNSTRSCRCPIVLVCCFVAESLAYSMGRAPTDSNSGISWLQAAMSPPRSGRPQDHGRPGNASAKKFMSAFQLQPILVPFYALFLSVIAGGLLMLAAGVNPIDAYWALLRGMFGSADRIAGSVARSVPYVGSALALTFAARAGLFNIGAEG